MNPLPPDFLTDVKMSAIYPNIKLPSKSAVQFSYVIHKIVVFESLTLFVSLHDAYGFTVDTRVLIMDGQDYLDWTEDTYIAKWIKKKLLE
jgi:hypothetical protein